jgi:hypothetical protein
MPINTSRKWKFYLPIDWRVDVDDVAAAAADAGVAGIDRSSS